RNKGGLERKTEYRDDASSLPPHAPADRRGVVIRAQARNENELPRTATARPEKLVRRCAKRSCAAAESFPRARAGGCGTARSAFTRYWLRRKGALPEYTCSSPSSSAMRRSWLYFAMRSLRLRLPVLIWPALVATARSAMNASSVSPERCEMIDV